MTESMSDAELAKKLAWADYLWELGETGVMAIAPEIARQDFERQWSMKERIREKWSYVADAAARRLLTAKADEDAAREIADRIHVHYETTNVYETVLAALAAQRRASDERIARLEALLWAAWRELHTIQARDGVPYTHGGFKAGVSEHYWAALTGMISDTLGEDAKPWPSEKTRPHLRVVQDYQDALETVAGERDEEGDR